MALTGAVAALMNSNVSATTPSRINLLTRVSDRSPFKTDCNGAPQTGTLYPNAEVEPWVAANPRNPANVVGVWQQDRWSNAGSNGLLTGVSFDAGLTWKRVLPPPFSRCTGGNVQNGGDYERATDPWVTFAPNGDAYQISLSFNDSNLLNAVLVSKSVDGGVTWDNPITLIRDEEFNDKEAITADPNDSNYVYAVWDRLSAAEGGPSYFSRTTDGGQTWEPARVIYNPGITSQTIGNQIVGLPNGDIVNLFTQIDTTAGGSSLASAVVIRSTDKGVTWSAPIKINDQLTIGTSDPATGLSIRDGSTIPDIAVDRKGILYVVWQDARFSDGQQDGVVLARSRDGGLTWSKPVQINRDPMVQAFTPSVEVASDNTLGITYYDLRSDTPSPATLLTDYWLVRSRDGRTGSESQISGPFNLNIAPFAGGFFLGDYQGLTSVGSLFLPFFVQTNETIKNRTDVFASLQLFGLARGENTGQQIGIALQQPDEAFLPSYSFAASSNGNVESWRQKVQENIKRVLMLHKSQRNR
jgi:hypothetical protein